MSNKAIEETKYRRPAKYKGGKGYTTMPVTASDRKMTIRHLSDSIAHNQEHAKDHKIAEKEAKKQLKAVKAGKGSNYS